MLRVTLRGLQGHLIRLLLTAAAVALGVSFITGTFVLRDSIDRTLGGLVSHATAGLDVSVRGAQVQGGSGAGDRRTVPLSLVNTLRTVPGVARVSPDLQGIALIAGRDGTAVRNGGAPTFGFAYSKGDPSFTLVRGRGPTSPGEVAVESATLAKSGLHIGDHTRAVIGGRTLPVLITGEVHFGSLFGATAILVDPTTARQVFAPDGTVMTITLTAKSDVSQDTLRRSVAAVLPAGDEAVTGQHIRKTTETAIQKGLGFFTILLLVFAGIALFVGSFIIVNTFSMLIAQRSRELALLRALGASRRQIVGSVLGEAAIVGFVGSAVGVGLGAALARGAKTAIHTYVGADLGTALPVTLQTVFVSLAVGVLVTIVAAVLPARRASRTSPIEAMGGDPPVAPRSLRRRAAMGVVVLVAGSVVLAASVAPADPSWFLAGTGAVFTILGTLIAAPSATRPVVRLVSWPFVALLGPVGRLAEQNALRVPRRTAATASALMIGLALVAAISVLAQSVHASVHTGVTNALKSDLVLSGGTAPLPGALAAEASRLPGVASVAALSQVPLKSSGFSTSATAVSGPDLGPNFKVTITSGRLDALRGSTILVDQTTATHHGWAVGEVVRATVGTLAHRHLRIGGIYRDNQAFASHVIVDRGLYLRAVPLAYQADLGVFIKALPGTDIPQLRTALTALVRPYLVVSVQNGTEFADAQASSIDVILNLLYALLLFSVVIAVLGIINTLALSVLERTREIGLLRAIGLRRTQLAQMITIEAVATAVFGAVLGTVLGLGLGIALQHGLASQGLTTLGIPWMLILVMLVASVLVGALAAIAPSVRAMRLTVLDAIASN